MSRIACVLLLTVVALSPPLYAKDKDPSLDKATKDVISDEDHPGNGKGRPENPGEHGRQNAAEKQSRGHSNGSKKEESWENESRDEVDADKKSKGDKKDKGNKKDKDKDK